MIVIRDRHSRGAPNSAGSTADTPSHSAITGTLRIWGSAHSESSTTTGWRRGQVLVSTATPTWTSYPTSSRARSNTRTALRTGPSSCRVRCSACRPALAFVLEVEPAVRGLRCGLFRGGSEVGGALGSCCGQELWYSHQIAGGGGECEGPADTLEAPVAGLGEIAGGLDPAEAFLDALANALAHGVARVPGR